MNNLNPTVFRRIAISRSNPNQILTLLNTVTNTIVQHPTSLTLIIKLTVLICLYKGCKDISIHGSTSHLNNTIDEHLFDNNRKQVGDINFSPCYL